MHVCFVSLSSYPLFDPRIQSIFGGSEVRAWLLGNGLAKRPGYKVSFIVLDHGQPTVTNYGNVSVHAHSCYTGPGARPRPPATDSLRARLSNRVRAFFASPPTLVGNYAITPEKLTVYEDVDADVYCGFGVGNGTVDIMVHCRNRKKKFVLFAGSSDDFSDMYREDSVQYNAYGSRADVCHYVIMKAGRIVTQTDDQRRLLRERFGREGMVLRNPFDFSGAAAPAAGGAATRRALWIGKSDLVKQPLVLLQLARRCPSVSFLMVMNRANARVYDQVMSEKPGNVEFVEHVPFGDSDRLFREAYVLVNTSVFEGFPNTFLQAGKYGVPMLSLNVDPDGFIARFDCGASAGGDLSRLAAQLDALRGNPELREQWGRNAYRYVREHHAIEDKIRELDALMQEMARGAQRS